MTLADETFWVRDGRRSGGAAHLGEPEVDTVPPPPRVPGPTASVHQILSAFIVKAYRFAGFAILTAILLALASYVGSHLFFLVNRGWVTPTMLTPATPKVLAFQSHFVEESARKDAMMIQRSDLETRRREAERSLALERSYQAAFAAAMRADLTDRQAELARFKGILGAHGNAERSFSAASQAFRSSSEGRLDQEFKAGVIDKDRMLAGNLQLAELAEAQLALGTRGVEIESRVATLARQVDAQAASYEILKIRIELDRSIAAAAKASDELDTTTKSIAMLDKTIEAQDRILTTMKASAYYGITEGPAVLAFVPYDNASSATKGASVYACRVGVFVCRRVGSLGAVADGEATEKHPLLHQDVRGFYMRINLDEPGAAQGTVLHVGRRPLFF